MPRAPLLALLVVACGGAEPLCPGKVESFPSPSGQHTKNDVHYVDAPPVGGLHHACWADFGVHSEEVPDERWVHNLEHGAIVLLHNCPEGCDRDIADLEDLALDLGPWTLVSPYERLPGPFAALAWGHRLLMDCYDPAQIEEFYAAHVDQGPESSLAGAPPTCM
jgi:hypothetical protein